MHQVAQRVHSDGLAFVSSRSVLKGYRWLSFTVFTCRVLNDALYCLDRARALEACRALHNGGMMMND